VYRPPGLLIQAIPCHVILRDLCFRCLTPCTQLLGAFSMSHKDASRREFDIVIAWSVDRLGRSLQDLIGFLSNCTASASTLPYINRASTPRRRLEKLCSGDGRVCRVRALDDCGTRAGWRCHGQGEWHQGRSPMLGCLARWGPRARRHLRLLFRPDALRTRMPRQAAPRRSLGRPETEPLSPALACARPA
jgi:hypothetical protein